MKITKNNSTFLSYKHYRIQRAINDDGLAFTPQCKLDLAEYQKQLENFLKDGTGTFWARKSKS